MLLESSVSQIKDFDNLPARSRIDLFVYYHTIINGREGVKSKDVNACFDELKINRYSNTPQYLSINSKKVKNNNSKFVLQNGLYHLERTKKVEIDIKTNAPRTITPTNNYFPLELFSNTRGYLETIASQATGRYDQGLYDACSVMTRKPLEVLIIEAFERHKISAKIKNSGGNFFLLK